MTLGDRLIVMNAGGVEQIGRPLDVYQRPATRFVAGFIGSPAMNFLQGAVVNRGRRREVVGGDPHRLGSTSRSSGRVETEALVSTSDPPATPGAGIGDDGPRPRAEVELVEVLGADAPHSAGPTPCVAPLDHVARVRSVKQARRPAQLFRGQRRSTCSMPPGSTSRCLIAMRPLLRGAEVAWVQSAASACSVTLACSAHFVLVSLGREVRQALEVIARASTRAPGDRVPRGPGCRSLRRVLSKLELWFETSQLRAGALQAMLRNRIFWYRFFGTGPCGPCESGLVLVAAQARATDLPLPSAWTLDENSTR